MTNYYIYPIILKMKYDNNNVLYRLIPSPCMERERGMGLAVQARYIVHRYKININL